QHLRYITSGTGIGVVAPCAADMTSALQDDEIFVPLFDQFYRHA
ncbi:MAG: hypothetical protein ACI91G_001567, partial [Gammaproteobacteria bacterium]